MVERLFTDRTLQDAYRALMQAAAATGHIDESTWDRIVANQIEPDARDRVFDHVLECDDCARVWRGVLALQEEAAAAGLVARERPAAPRWWQSGLVPLAAAAALVIAVSGVLMTRQPPETATVRSSTAIPALDGLMMSHSSEGVPMFIWTPVPGAARYHVELFTDDGRPVWSREVDAPPMRWPGDVPRSTGTFHWRVEAIGPEGVTARSRLTAVEISR
jgi:hypothetical protein